MVNEIGNFQDYWNNDLLDFIQKILYKLEYSTQNFS